MMTATEGTQSQELAVLSEPHALASSKSEDACQPEQPPAYKPSTRTRNLESLSSYFAGHGFASDSGGSGAFPQFDSISDAAVDDDLEEPSPISLRISTQIKVSSDGNLISLPFLPAEQATSMAMAVIEAIQGRDWTTGLPMIDENGRPRPLRLEIDAEITVEGSSNIIGTESIVAQFLRHGTHTPNTSLDRPSGSEASPPKQRRRWPRDSATDDSVRKRSQSE